ncbi:hypothetical protein PRIPAC_70290 [Pristionchus pacificus]|uniref:Uncharacterized protein n=1 Tax=Pristionchus pacificus TaxID=54126 RepID=A0A2A6CRK5_PRIPA|nr:hypothetical protein PRIPAC_70290 [Pristionchus pacificus]|eukprot:PDM80750.1 hypothetical protein PRIPAC_35753 [Pristionchus pacificus]
MKRMEESIMKNKKGHESFSNEHEMDEKEDEKHQKISLRWNLKNERIEGKTNEINRKFEVISTAKTKSFQG